jgi:hypothetical protein
MFLLIQLFFLLASFEYILSEDILLPLFNQSLVSISSPYLCHVHQLNNLNDVFLEGYYIINSGNSSHVHHLLLYECSIKDKLLYSGLCGMHNARLMPQSVYRHCQTRILVAWAQGGQLKYNYPTNTGLKMTSYTQLLLEVHFEPSIPHNQSIGIHLQFYPIDKKPQDEIGVLTLGTLAESPLLLPPRLDTIRFPTYCFNDCLKSFLRKNLQINIFSILVHAHRHATRIILEDNNFNRLIDQNPFEFHRQKTTYFSKPYPQITSTNELSLICYYSTRMNSFKVIYGGYHSNDEMCQAFLYYYPKIDSFPLCLSLPVYNNKHTQQNWTDESSLLIKYQLESNRNHLSLCGDNIYLNNTNQTILQRRLYQRSMDNIKSYSYFSSSFYTLLVFLLLIFIILYFLIVKKHLHSFSNGGTLLDSIN